MEGNTSMNVSSAGFGLVDQIENVLRFCPANPFLDPFAAAWIYMTDNYTKFQIATWGSIILHEVKAAYSTTNY